MAALVQEEARRPQVLLVAGDTVELDQADLDLLVAGHIVDAVRAEGLADEVGVAWATSSSVRLPVA